MPSTSSCANPTSSCYEFPRSSGFMVAHPPVVTPGIVGCSHNYNQPSRPSDTIIEVENLLAWENLEHQSAKVDTVEKYLEKGVYDISMLKWKSSSSKACFDTQHRPYITTNRRFDSIQWWSRWLIINHGNVITWYDNSIRDDASGMGHISWRCTGKRGDRCYS